MNVDLVYLWVNGNDPDFVRSKAPYNILPGAMEDIRWDCHEELRYSLRSIARYAPWIDRIFIVTNGQVPTWIDTSKVTMIRHDQIYRDQSHLPTFNSCSIESHLHRIPGLSERFIYANDDTLLGHDVTEQDFFVDGKIVVNTKDIELDFVEPIASGKHGENKALFLLNLISPGQTFYKSCHQMRPLTKKLYYIAERQFRESFHRSSQNRFRGQGDLSLAMLLPNLALIAGLGVETRTKEAMYLSVGQDTHNAIVSQRPKFFCVQNSGCPKQDYIDLFEKLFPEPSPYES